MKKRWLGMMTALAGILLAGTAQAEVSTWVGLGANNRMITAGNWSPSRSNSNTNDLLFVTPTSGYTQPGSTYGNVTARSITYSNITDVAHSLNIWRASTKPREFAFSSDTGTSTITVDSGVVAPITISGGIASGAQNPLILNSDLDIVHNGTSTLTLSARITGTNSIVKLGSGELILSSTNNAYTGNTTVSEGTLMMSGNLLFDINTNANNNLTGTGVVNLDGSFTFDLTDATTEIGDSWMIVDMNNLIETFGENFSVVDFLDDGNDTWTLAIDTTKSYVFSESTGLLTIEEGSVNTPPIADAQSVSTLPETPVTITLTGSDVQGSDLTYYVVSDPANGSFEGATNIWTYTPDPGFEGEASFTFTVNDGLDDSAPATVTITVVNELPTATPQTVEAYRNVPLAITLTGTDTDGPSNLTYSVLVSTSPGTLNTNAGANLVYTPQTGFIGEDGFVFKVNDGLADSEDAIVTITVINNPPVADPKVTWTEPDTPVDVTLSGYDPDDSGSLSFNVATWPVNGILDGTEPNMTYTPTNGFTGVDTFTYTANDADVDGEPATVSITVSSNGLSLVFQDLNSVLSNNTANVSGLPIDVTGVMTEGSNYFYSGSCTEVDVDRDGSNDTITFDVLVEAWTGGSISNTVAGGVTGTNGTAVIGTTNAPVTMGSLGGLGWGVTGERMYAGETLKFTVSNLNVILTDAGQSATATITGFVGTHLQEIGNAHSHQTVFGEGTELLETTWSLNDQYVDGFIEDSDQLLISQANNYLPAHNKAYNWKVRDVDFGINITLGAGESPEIIIGMNPGGDMVLSWEGGAFNVLSNINLAVPSGWGVAVEDATSPVTLPVAGDQVFYKLISE